VLLSSIDLDAVRVFGNIVDIVQPFTGSSAGTDPRRMEAIYERSKTYYSTSTGIGDAIWASLGNGNRWIKGPDANLSILLEALD
jgi:hypothetical protein